MDLRMRLLALGCTLALTAGCEPLAEDPVYLYTRAERADGTPWEGLEVVLEARVPDSWQDAPPPLPGPPFAAHARGQADARGDVTLASTDGYVNAVMHRMGVSAPEFRVALPLLPDGSGVACNFRWMGSDTELPALRPWRAEARVQPQEAGALQLLFAPPPAPVPLPPTMGAPWPIVGPDGQRLEYSPPRPWVVVQVWQGDALAWRQRVRVGADGEVGDVGLLPASVREDLDGLQAQVRVAVDGSWYFEPLVGRVGSASWRLDWRSGRLALPAGGARPLSRGAACLGDAEGVACPWTDGAMAPVRPPAGAAVGVTLATPVQVRRAVVRGLTFDLRTNYPDAFLVEGSADGLTWTELARVPVFFWEPQDPAASSTGLLSQKVETPWDPPLAVTDSRAHYADLELRTGPEPVRHVRLRGVSDDPRASTPPQVVSLQELSLY